MTRVLVLLASAAVAISAADASLLNRAQLAAAEQNVDSRLIRLWSDNSLSLVGATRAAYLPGVGLVVSAEVSMITAPLSLMGDALNEKGKADLRKKKADRYPVLRSAMKEVLVSLAATVAQIPATEQIAFSVVLPRYTWEDPKSVPMQVTVQATKRSLLAAQSGGPAALDTAVRITETN